MVQTVTATYARTDENWTVRVSGLGRELDAEASGIIAARDRADQLVDELVSGDEQPTVVHLIDGSAVEFTSTYMAARLAGAGGTGAPERSGTIARAGTTDTGTAAGTDAAPADGSAGAGSVSAGSEGTGSDTSGTGDGGTAPATDTATDAARADGNGTEDTASDNGTADAGAAHDETAHDGAADDGTADDEAADNEATAAPLRTRTPTVPRKELSRTPGTAPGHSSDGASADADEPAYAHAAH